jgi:hypothetical protein
MAEHADKRAAARAATYPKTASCTCGGLTATVSAPPKMTHACSCLACQRGTGSAFSYSAFFAEDVVQTAGESRSYRRTTDSGRWQETTFCPVCGVCVLTRLEALPGIIDVSVGCFADPGFEKPQNLWWASRRHHWLEPPPGVEPVETQ